MSDLLRLRLRHSCHLECVGSYLEDQKRDDGSVLCFLLLPKSPTIDETLVMIVDNSGEGYRWAGGLWHRDSGDGCLGTVRYTISHLLLGLME